jgi:hypothetical protein
MVKRLTALFFIFLIAGQAYAGVCGCLSGQSMTQHACCKRQKLKIDSMRSTTCCDTDCILRQSEKLPQDRTQAVDKLLFQHIAEPLAIVQISFHPVLVRTAPAALSKVDHRLKFARPPDIVVLNCAFLI